MQRQMRPAAPSEDRMMEEAIRLIDEIDMNGKFKIAACRTHLEY